VLAVLTCSIADLSEIALVLCVEFGAQFRIDRDQPVLATDFHAMAGEIDHRHVGAALIAAELKQRAAHVVECAIEQGRYRETESLQRGGNIGRVIARVQQRRSVLHLAMHVRRLYCNVNDIQVRSFILNGADTIRTCDLAFEPFSTRFSDRSTGCFPIGW
jgi:hypothetical protein